MDDNFKKGEKMKTTVSIFTLIALLISAPVVSAKDDCHYKMAIGGYIAGQEDISTVKAIEGMEDDSMVTLQGHIIKRLKKDMYQFKDSTGTINIKIKKKVWHGQTISAQDVVQIMGEVEKERDGTKIDVESLIKK